jgi:hypothetical protein
MRLLQFVLKNPKGKEVLLIWTLQNLAAKKGNKYNPKGGFKKGQSGNPLGLAVRMPEFLKMRNYTREQIDTTLLNMIGLTNAELDERLGNVAATQLELMVGSIIKKAVETGCNTRLNFLLERIIGKVRDSQPAIPIPDSHVEQPTVDMQPQTALGERVATYVVEMSEAGKFKHARPQLVSVTEKEK